MNADTRQPSFKPSVNLWPPMAEKEYTLALREFVAQRVMPQGDDIDERDIISRVHDMDNEHMNLFWSHLNGSIRTD